MTSPEQLDSYIASPEFSVRGYDGDLIAQACSVFSQLTEKAHENLLLVAWRDVPWRTWALALRSPALSTRNACVMLGSRIENRELREPCRRVLACRAIAPDLAATAVEDAVASDGITQELSTLLAKARANEFDDRIHAARDDLMAFKGEPDRYSEFVLDAWSREVYSLTGASAGPLCMDEELLKRVDRALDPRGCNAAIALYTIALDGHPEQFPACVYAGRPHALGEFDRDFLAPLSVLSRLRPDMSEARACLDRAFLVLRSLAPDKAAGLEESYRDFLAGSEQPDVL